MNTIERNAPRTNLPDLELDLESDEMGELSGGFFCLGGGGCGQPPSSSNGSFIPLGTPGNRPPC